jgi:hypothetical protein
MSSKGTTHETRGQLAEAAWSALPRGGRDQVRLRVQCARGHHVAAVHATDAGLVYVAPLRAHSHGSYDRPAEPHGDQRPHQWFDLVAVTDSAADDPMPAWCACGHRTLSRSAVQQWLAAGERRVVID